MAGSILTETIHPFGMAGNLNTTGVIYGTTISTEGSTAFIEVEEVTVSLPANSRMIELEVGLTMGIAISTTTDSPKITYNIKNTAQASYDTLLALTSTTLTGLASTGTTSLLAWVSEGRKTPSNGTYFTGNGTFDLQATIASNATTSNARGAMTQDSWITYKYFLI